MYDVKAFIDRVAQLREQRGISEQEYSDRSNQEFYTNLRETAHNGLSGKMMLENVIIAADILGTSTDYLLGRTIDPRLGLTEDQLIPDPRSLP